MQLIKSLLLLVFISAPASATDKQWRLDILVFERDTAAAVASHKGRFQDIAWPAMLAIDNEAGNPLPDASFDVVQAAQAQGIAIFPLQTSSLRDAAKRLNSTGRYQVVAEYSIGLARNTVSPPMRLHNRIPIRLQARDTRDPYMSSVDYWQSQPDLEPPTDTETLIGWFQLEHRTHAMLNLDISYLRIMPGIFPIQLTPEGVREYYRDQVLQYRLKTSRKLNPGKLAYFDHPRFGVLARLTDPAQSHQAPDSSAE